MDNNNIESVSPTSELINAILNDNNNIEVAFCDTLDANNTKNEEDTRVDLNSISSNSGDEPQSTSSVADTAVSSRKHVQKLRNEGKSYISKSGKIVPGRVLRKLEPCRKNCADKISYEQQKIIHKNYWSQGSYALRRATVSGLMEVQQTKTIKRFKTDLNSRKRDHTYSYFLEIGSEKISLCQKCFRYTLCESEQFLKSVAKVKISGTGLMDKHGKHRNARKLSSEKENEIFEFIKSFPSYESHYNRRDTTLRYLPSDLSVAAMHRLYCEKYDHSVSLFNKTTLFNKTRLKFKKPKVDTCHKCDLFQHKLSIATSEEVGSLKAEQANHHNEAQQAYDSKKADKAKAMNDVSLKVFCFDLQKCLPTPMLRTSLSFYKRPLWTFNLTVHYLVSNQPICYMWHEALAKRVGNEIASCIFNHLLNMDSNTKHVVFYSDCCPGQNKNSYVATMFAIFVQMDNNLTTVDHKFLVPGHTHMECDSDHALIEKKKKNTMIKIHHPRDWYQFVRSIGLKKQFLVTEMDQNNICI